MHGGVGEVGGLVGVGLGGGLGACPRVARIVRRHRPRPRLDSLSLLQLACLLMRKFRCVRHVRNNALLVQRVIDGF